MIDNEPKSLRTTNQEKEGNNIFECRHNGIVIDVINACKCLINQKISLLFWLKRNMAGSF